MDLQRYVTLVKSLLPVDATTDPTSAVIVVFQDMVGRARFQFMRVADPFGPYSFTNGTAAYDKTMADLDRVDEVEITYTSDTTNFVRVTKVDPDKLTMIKSGQLVADDTPVVAHIGLTTGLKHRFEFYPTPEASWVQFQVTGWLQGGEGTIARMPDKWAKTLVHGVADLLGKAQLKDLHKQAYEMGCRRMRVQEKIVPDAENPMQLPPFMRTRNRENARLQ